MGRKILPIAFLGLPKSLFDYPLLVPDLPEIQHVHVGAHVFQVSFRVEETLSPWNPWITPRDADEATRDLALFLTYHEYCRIYNHGRAGKDLTDGEKKKPIVDITRRGVQAVLPQLATKVTVRQGLTATWQSRVGEELVVTDFPMLHEFDATSLPIPSLTTGRGVWMRWFDSHLRPKITPMIKKSEDRKEELGGLERAICTVMLAAPEVADSPLVKKFVEAVCDSKKKKSSKGGGSAVSLPHVGHNKPTAEQPMLVGEPSASVAAGSGEHPLIDEQPVYDLASPTSYLSGITGGSVPLEPVEIAWDGEIGVHAFQSIDVETLRGMLSTSTSGELSGLRSDVRLAWHQMVFVVFALARLFQPQQANPWGGLGLMDAPGLGKTASTLGLHAILMAELAQQRGSAECSRITPMLKDRSWFQSMQRIPERPSCIIVPDALAHQWEAEARRFLAGPISIHLVSDRNGLSNTIHQVKKSPDPHGSYLIIIPKSVLTASYKAVKNPKEAKPEGDLYDIDLLSVYVDEMHLCRNNNDLFEAVYQLTKRALVRLGLTATPLPTTLTNVMYEGRALQMDGLVGETGQKNIQHVNTGLGKAKNIGSGTEKGWEKVAEQVTLVKHILCKNVLRRTTSSRDSKGSPLLFLKPLSVSQVEIEMKEHEISALDALDALVSPDQKKNGGDVQLKHSQGFHTSARRALTHVAYSQWVRESPDSQQTQSADYIFPTLDIPDPTPSSKLKWICDKILAIFHEDKDCAPDQRRKVLLCTEWSGMFPIIEATLNLAGIRASFISGSLSAKNKATLLEQLNTAGPHPDRDGQDAWVAVLAMSLAVGSNCQRASVVITMDTLWSYADYEQAFARCWRLGQTRDVEAYALITKGTIEQNMYCLAFTKQRMMHSLTGVQPEARTRSRALAGLGDTFPKRGAHRQDGQDLTMSLTDGSQASQVSCGVFSKKIATDHSDNTEAIAGKEASSSDPCAEQLALTQTAWTTSEPDESHLPGINVTLPEDLDTRMDAESHVASAGPEDSGRMQQTVGDEEVQNSEPEGPGSSYQPVCSMPDHNNTSGSDTSGLHSSSSGGLTLSRGSTDEQQIPEGTSYLTRSDEDRPSPPRSEPDTNANTSEPDTNSDTSDSNIFGLHSPGSGALAVDGGSADGTRRLNTSDQDSRSSLRSEPDTVADRMDFEMLLDGTEEGEQPNPTYFRGGDSDTLSDTRTDTSGLRPPDSDASALGGEESGTEQQMVHQTDLLNLSDVDCRSQSRSEPDTHADRLLQPRQSSEDRQGDMDDEGYLAHEPPTGSGTGYDTDGASQASLIDRDSPRLMTPPKKKKKTKTTKVSKLLPTWARPVGAPSTVSKPSTLGYSEQDNRESNDVGVSSPQLHTGREELEGETVPSSQWVIDGMCIPPSPPDSDREELEEETVPSDRCESDDHGQPQRTSARTANRRTAASIVGSTRAWSTIMLSPSRHDSEEPAGTISSGRQQEVLYLENNDIEPLSPPSAAISSQVAGNQPAVVATPVASPHHERSLLCSPPALLRVSVVGQPPSSPPPPASPILLLKPKYRSLLSGSVAQVYVDVPTLPAHVAQTYKRIPAAKRPATPRSPETTEDWRSEQTAGPSGTRHSSASILADEEVVELPQRKKPRRQSKREDNTIDVTMRDMPADAILADITISHDAFATEMASWEEAHLAEMAMADQALAYLESPQSSRLKRPRPASRPKDRPTITLDNERPKKEMARKCRVESEEVELLPSCDEQPLKRKRGRSTDRPRANAASEVIYISSADEQPMRPPPRRAERRSSAKGGRSKKGKERALPSSSESDSGDQYVPPEDDEIIQSSDDEELHKMKATKGVPVWTGRAPRKTQGRVAPTLAQVLAAAPSAAQNLGNQTMPSPFAAAPNAQIMRLAPIGKNDAEAAVWAAKVARESNSSAIKHARNQSGHTRGH